MVYHIAFIIVSEISHYVEPRSVYFYEMDSLLAMSMYLML
jgi:hypothetical protein